MCLKESYDRDLLILLANSSNEELQNLYSLPGVIRIINHQHPNTRVNNNITAGAGNIIQIGTNDNTKKGLTNRSETRTPSRNIEPHHLDKWTTPLIEVQELHNFKKFKTKIKLES
jgi:hypothetical protein